MAGHVVFLSSWCCLGSLGLGVSAGVGRQLGEEKASPAPQEEMDRTTLGWVQGPEGRRQTPAATAAMAS